MIEDSQAEKPPSPVVAPQQPASTDDGASPAPRPISTRSVRWMSPSKLDRKRTLDRLNQRASRAKTRARVDELEKEVLDLKSRLQDAEAIAASSRRRADALSAAIKVLHSAMLKADELTDDVTEIPEDSIGEVAKGGFGGVIITVGDDGRQVKDCSGRRKRRRSIVSTHRSAHHPEPAAACNEPQLTKSDPIIAHFPVLDVQVPSTDTFYDQGVSVTDPNSGFKYGLPSLGDNTTTMPYSPQPENVIDLRVADFSFNLINHDFAMTSDPAVDAPWAGSLDHAWDHVRQQSDKCMHAPQDPRPVWSVPMQHLPPQIRLDHLMLSMAEALRHLGARSSQPSEYHSPTFPSVKSLLNPQDASESQTHPVSVALGRHGNIWTNVHALPEKMALLHGIGRLVRWQVQPNKANWEAMLPSMRPTDLQRQVPHPAWVDSLQWAEARDFVIRQGAWSIVDELRDHFNANFCINWPHPTQDLFVAVGEGEMELSPTFLAHIRDLRNWTADTDWTGRLSFLRTIIPRRVVK